MEWRGFGYGRCHTAKVVNGQCLKDIQNCLRLFSGIRGELKCNILRATIILLLRSAKNCGTRYRTNNKQRASSLESAITTNLHKTSVKGLLYRGWTRNTRYNKETNQEIAVRTIEKGEEEKGRDTRRKKRRGKGFCCSS